MSQREIKILYYGLINVSSSISIFRHDDNSHCKMRNIILREILIPRGKQSPESVFFFVLVQVSSEGDIKAANFSLRFSRYILHSCSLFFLLAVLIDNNRLRGRSSIARLQFQLNYAVRGSDPSVREKFRVRIECSCGCGRGKRRVGFNNVFPSRGCYNG